MRTEIVLASVNLAGILLLLASFFAFEGFCAAEQRLLVGMTVVRGAAAAGAVESPETACGPNRQMRSVNPANWIGATN
ncbi:hypothetical protein ACLOJK_015557 [Asimina triloba]